MKQKQILIIIGFVGLSIICLCLLIGGGWFVVQGMSGEGPLAMLATATRTPRPSRTPEPTFTQTSTPTATNTSAPTFTPTTTTTPTLTNTPEPELEVDPTGQTVTFWHVWGSGDRADAMASIVDYFNAMNEWGITVEALDMGFYSDLENIMNAAIQTGDVPTTLVGYPNALASWHMLDILVDFDDFIYDPMFGLSEDDINGMYAGAFNGGVTHDGTRVGWPISQSANVMFYNSSWAQELGFDSPPTNAAEFKEQACAASAANDADADPDNDGTGGLVLSTGASNVMSFIYAFGGTGLNDAEDGYDFTSQEVLDAVLYMKDLQDSGCTLETDSYPDPEFAGRKALFVMSSTGALPYQLAAFEDAGNDDEWTLLPFLGPDGTTAIDVFGQYVAIVETTPEQNLASWIFIKYLTSPEVQTEWIQASGYFPTQGSTIPLLADYAADNPIWAFGLQLIEHGHSEPALASWFSVRREIQDIFSAILEAENEDEAFSFLDILNYIAADLVAELD